MDTPGQSRSKVVTSFMVRSGHILDSEEDDDNDTLKPGDMQTAKLKSCWGDQTNSYDKVS